DYYCSSYTTRGTFVF
nr:immunoglobulin light chain junction region [Macaca mulatta]MOV94319.1 immunoglobulin light chain junction region [Macaca mulatta]MOV94399.1 immunoglobulin light chain junction region [Macaca mulatta]MOV94420.1 immunoglobulin light chain junction region [Macaca mulatta]MOV94449.1 immunoglobulin light chain junction region [Macaca mulatta]